MPVDEAIGTGLKIVLELIKAFNPTDLERVKREIRKRENEIQEKKNKLREAIINGDIDAINALFFS